MKKFNFKGLMLFAILASFSVLLFGCGEHSHNLTEWRTQTKETCTQAEVLIRNCLGCDFEETKKGLDAIGHNWQESIILPTHNSNGYTLHTCDRCYENYKDQYTYLISFECETSNININQSDLPKVPSRIYDEDEKFYGFNNTSLYKIVEYRIYKQNNTYDVLNINDTFNQSTTVTIVWDDINAQKPPAEHQHSYSTSTVQPTQTSAGYTLHLCGCGDNYKTDYKYLITFNSITENVGVNANSLPQINSIIYSQNEGFKQVADTSNFKVVEYRVYSGNNNYNVLNLNNTFTNSTKVTIVWESKEYLQNLESFNEVVAVIEELETLSASYNETNSLTKDVNLRVMQYFRTLKYNDSKWNLIAGTLEDDFENYVLTNATSKTVTKIQEYKQANGEITVTIPYTNEKIDLVHMFAVINAVKTNFSMPLLNISAGQSHDLAGWAGDLCQLVDELADKNLTGNALLQMARELFNKTSTFGAEDVCSDIDAINIMTIYNEQTIKSISDAINTYYNETYEDYLTNQNKSKQKDFVFAVFGEVETSSGLQSVILDRLKSNPFITGISSIQGLLESYGISFDGEAEEFSVVIQVFVEYILEL